MAGRLTRRRALALGATLLFALSTPAGGTVVQAPLPPPRPLAAAPAEGRAGGAAARQAIDRPRPRHSGTVGWIAIDLDSGAVIDAANADRPFAPASVAKLVTTAYALDRLGWEYRFETRLLVAGAVRDGVLNGDLILAGGGNPEFDTDELQTLVKALAEAGIRRIGGRFLVDGSAAPQRPVIDAGQPVEAAYNPAVSGLSLNFNRVRLTWDIRARPRQLRLSARAEALDPEVRGVRVTLEEAPGRAPFVHALMGGSELWQLAPDQLRGSGGRWLPVRRPEIYAGEVFAILAAKEGISVPAAEEGPAPPGARLLARHQSRPLGPMLRGMLYYSTNLTAELAGFAASAGDGRRPADLAASAQRMNAWARARAGLPPGSGAFALTNHSGLSAEARVTPRALARLLVRTAGNGRGAGAGARYPRLPEGLPQIVPRGSIAAGSVPLDYARIELGAKTGTMDYVRGLAGFMVTPGGRRLAFAIFSNDLDRRRPGTSRIDRRWMAGARNFERALLRNWVKALEG